VLAEGIAQARDSSPPQPRLARFDGRLPRPISRESMVRLEGCAIPCRAAITRRTLLAIGRASRKPRLLARAVGPRPVAWLAWLVQTAFWVLAQRVETGGVFPSNKCRVLVQNGGHVTARRENF